MGADSHTNYALRKNGLQPVEPLHPELAEPLRDILEGTYGLIVYQEQVMLIAQRVAGYTLGGADLLRRVMGKKKPEELQREYEPFSRGMRERGFSEAAIDALWETLVPFAAYAFNKAHSAAYGLVSYWTAYLKTHYPTEYMAALLTSVRGDKDKSAVYLAECRRMGITVLPPDVNSSSAYFTPVGRDIRFGLAAVRNVGIGVVDAIEEARTEKGAYTSFQDFLNKVGVQACNKRVIESLIKAGAFDAFDLTRRAMHEKHEEAVDSVMGVKRKEAIGQFDLFGELNQAHEVAVPIPELPEWPRDTVLSFEREMLGLYVSGHPLNGLETALTRIAEDTAAGLADAEAYPDGKQITLAGLMTGLERRVTKLGKLWAQAALEDLEGSVELKFFPKVYARLAPLLAEDLVVWVKGRVKRDDDEVMLSVSDLRPLDLEPTGEASPLVIKVAERRANEAVLSSLKHVLSIHPGQSEVWLRLEKQGGATVMRLDHNYQVEESEALKGDLFALLGPGCV
jgi:DNA polymerase-3 subunit alpha